MEQEVPKAAEVPLQGVQARSWFVEKGRQRNQKLTYCREQLTDKEFRWRQKLLVELVK
jgi:hypothetical protein